MLTVEKIGGTSISALEEVINNIIFFGRDSHTMHNRVFVVSAFSGVTNILLENKKTKAPGIYHLFATGEPYQSALNEVTKHLKQLNEKYGPLGLDVHDAD